MHVYAYMYVCTYICMYAYYVYMFVHVYTAWGPHHVQALLQTHAYVYAYVWSPHHMQALLQTHAASGAGWHAPGFHSGYNEVRNACTCMYMCMPSTRLDPGHTHVRMHMCMYVCTCTCAHVRIQLLHPPR